MSKDKLDQIFDAQEKFRRLMGKGQDCIVDLMTEQQKGQLIYDHCQAITSELQELINCIYWKSWAKEAKEGKRYMFRNKENLKEEIADILCFLGDICAAVDMDAEELAAINVRKTEVNIERQLTKYAMDTKDGKDSEAVWQQIKDGELKKLEQVNKKKFDDLAKREEEYEKEQGPLEKLPIKQVKQDDLMKLAPKYLSEQPERVIIESLGGHSLDTSPAMITANFNVTLESTNETKKISIGYCEDESSSARGLLMKKISAEFNLTKPFEIVEP